MALFRKRPVAVEAVQWPGEDRRATIDVLYQWVMAAGISGTSIEIPKAPDDGILIGTLEGVMRANPGDWILRGVKGEVYPCKADIFAETYEPATGVETDERDELREARIALGILSTVAPHVEVDVLDPVAMAHKIVAALTEGQPAEGGDSLEEKLRHAINYHSAESPSNTPDFLLAQFLLGVLEAYNRTLVARERWSRGGSDDARSALDEAWVDGFSTGADGAWCSKRLRRMGHGEVEAFTEEAARLLIASCADHRQESVQPTPAEEES